MKQLIRKLLKHYNYTIVKTNQHQKLPEDFEEFHKYIYNRVKDNTMTSPQRIYSLIEAVKYVERCNIPGDIVECGVWKGGSMMAVANTLMFLKKQNRRLYLYDTYEGMSEPTEHDKTFYGEQAVTLLEKNKNKEENLVWAYSALDTVKKGMHSTTYPESKILYVKGKVEDTIPGSIPEKIALLRLDTDWYESTKHELEFLFPLLAKGGVLILDDYGHWAGAKKAVDEYFTSHKISILLNRIDETGRIGVKQ